MIIYNCHRKISRENIRKFKEKSGVEKITVKNLSPEKGVEDILMSIYTPLGKELDTDNKEELIGIIIGGLEKCPLAAAVLAGLIKQQRSITNVIVIDSFTMEYTSLTCLVDKKKKMKNRSRWYTECLTVMNPKPETYMLTW